LEYNSKYIIRQTIEIQFYTFFLLRKIVSRPPPPPGPEDQGSFSSRSTTICVSLECHDFRHSTSHLYERRNWSSISFALCSFSFIHYCALYFLTSSRRIFPYFFSSRLAILNPTSTSISSLSLPRPLHSSPCTVNLQPPENGSHQAGEASIL
jgi:hypothetical protein